MDRSSRTQVSEEIRSIILRMVFAGPTLTLTKSSYENMYSPDDIAQTSEEIFEAIIIRVRNESII